MVWTNLQVGDLFTIQNIQTNTIWKYQVIDYIDGIYSVKIIKIIINNKNQEANWDLGKIDHVSPSSFDTLNEAYIVKSDINNILKKL